MWGTIITLSRSWLFVFRRLFFFKPPPFSRCYDHTPQPTDRKSRLESYALLEGSTRKQRRRQQRGGH
uniref:Putative secreted protein n=1 Tax=Anopheles marajoara TaxID=58244 RepID=A0A2M4CFQ5_9DIPT